MKSTSEPAALVNINHPLMEAHAVATKAKFRLPRKKRKAFIAAMLDRFLPKMPSMDTSRRTTS